MKLVRFMGSAKSDLSAFPKSARLRAGHELFMVQVGRDPDDLKLARRRYRDARQLAEGVDRG